MGFVVLPALVPDISAVYDVYFEAFKNNAVTRALFPSASEADLTDAKSEFRYVLTGSLSISGRLPLVTLECELIMAKAGAYSPRFGVVENQRDAVHSKVRRH